jgi:hypothetical protein
MYGMVVRRRQINGLLKTVQCRILRTACARLRDKKYRSRGAYPKMHGAHKDWDQSALTITRKNLEQWLEPNDHFAKLRGPYHAP